MRTPNCASIPTGIKSRSALLTRRPKNWRKLPPPLLRRAKTLAPRKPIQRPNNEQITYHSGGELIEAKELNSPDLPKSVAVSKRRIMAATCPPTNPSAPMRIQRAPSRLVSGAPDHASSVAKSSGSGSGAPRERGNGGDCTAPEGYRQGARPTERITRPLRWSP